MTTPGNTRSPAAAGQPKEAADNDRMVEAALTRLRGLGPEGADLAQRLESGQLTRQAIQGEAVFLAYLSLGLRLGAARRL